jgi:hypothetical protein
MSVPYTFATATGSIPLSQLDSNFATGITIGNTSVLLGGTISTINNASLANVTITSVNQAFPNGYLVNSNVVLGTTTLTLGNTVTSVDGLTLSNVSLVGANVTISSVSITTANVSGTANISNLVVIGNASVGGNVSVTGNVTGAKGTFTSSNISGIANVTTLAVVANATVGGNVTISGNVSALNGFVTIGNTTVGLGNTTATLGNTTVANTTVTLYTESVVAIGNSSTSKTLDLTSGTFQTVTMTGNCTFTMPTNTAGRSFVLVVSTGAGGFTGTFTSVKWPNNGAPTLTTTASRWDILTFFADGTNWYGTFAQAFQ